MPSLSLQCIKTGFDAFVRNRDLWLHGDAFVIPALIESGDGFAALGAPKRTSDFYDRCQHIVGRDWLLLRICDIEYKQAPPRLNLDVMADAQWFGEASTSMRHNSTMLVAPGQWHWLSYAGDTATSNG